MQNLTDSSKTDQKIKDYLKENIEPINKKIEEYFPRKIDDKFMEWVDGPARYEHDKNAIQKGVIDPMWELLDRGGKRWRPALSLLIGDIFGIDKDEMLDYAIIPEIIHNMTLMVDDIEDDAKERRGKPPIHELFGADVAINGGNALYYFPLKIIERNITDPLKKLQLYEAYNQEMIHVSLGQAMDISWHNGENEDITVNQYLQMCAYKTGSLARLAVRIPAILSSDSTPELEDTIARYIESVGVAFQIKDDVLDITDYEKLGKVYGNDIHEGKRTLMVVYALEKAKEEGNETNRRTLIDILNKHTEDKKEIDEAIKIIYEYKAIEYAQDVAKDIVDKAWNEVNLYLPDSDKKTMLKDFADYMINRNH